MILLGHFSIIKEEFAFLKSAEDNLQLDIQRGKLEMVFVMIGSLGGIIYFFWPSPLLLPFLVVKGE